MNNQSKAYAILLYMLLPFSALIVGLRDFDSNFGKRLLIALYAFLGFTAFSVGDLERYESEFYNYKTATFSQIFVELISLQTGKFYNSFVSVVSGLVFESHHYYFLILFLVYGFFYVTIVCKLKEINVKSLNRFGLLFFFALLLFLLVRPLFSVAFYTGGVFILYNVVLYYKNNSRNNLLFILLAPLFHIGLTIYLIVPALLLLFKNKTWSYVLFVFLTFAVGQSSIVRGIETIASANSGSIIEEKYKSYADEKGRQSLDKSYTKNSANNNIKAQILVNLQNAICYFFVPLGMVLIYLKRNLLIINHKKYRLFHIVLLFWGVSNLMLNISQGERFLILFCFIAIGFFFTVYVSTKDLSRKTIFSKYLYVFVPLLFIFGLMAAYASNEMFIAPFFISNFFIEIITYSFKVT